MYSRTLLLVPVIVSLVLSACIVEDNGSDDPTPTQEPAGSEATSTVPAEPTLVIDAEIATLETIADAEHEAETWPVAQPPQNPSPLFAEPAAGSPERVCVEVQPGVADNGAWRSGEFLAGHFDRYLEERPKDPRYSKLWWLPLHNHPDDLVGVTVRATRLDEPGEPVPMRVFTFDQVAWPAPPPDITPTPTPLPEGQHPDYFYPSGLALPSGGRWMLVATMGPDWGCYVIELAG